MLDVLSPDHIFLKEVLFEFFNVLKGDYIKHSYTITHIYMINKTFAYVCLNFPSMDVEIANKM